MLRQLTRKTKSPRLTPCPTKLGLLLDLLNLIPPDVELKPIDVDLEQISGYDDDFTAEYAFAEHNQIQLYSRDLPIDFQSRLWWAPDAPFDRNDSTLRGRFLNSLMQRPPKHTYDKLVKLLDAKVGLKTYTGWIADARFEYDTIGLWREGFLKLSRLGQSRKEVRDRWILPMSGTIVLDPSGIVRCDKCLFTEAVDDVDATRIRECAVCKRLFWAGRIDQSCCSPVCNHVRHSRRTRRKTLCRVPPAETESVRRCLTFWHPKFRRTPENTKELANQAGIATARCARVLDYLEWANYQAKGR